MRPITLHPCRGGPVVTPGKYAQHVSTREDDEQRSAILQRIGSDTSNLELLNGELSSRLNRQEDASSKIDTKVAFLLGLIATATQFLATRHPQPVLGTLAFLSYAAAFALGTPALVIRSYSEIEPKDLLDRYGDKSKVETLLALCAVRVDTFEKNDTKHQRKTTWWWRSFIATIVGLVLSVTAIVDAGTRDNPAGQQRPAPTASSVGPAGAPSGPGGVSATPSAKH